MGRHYHGEDRQITWQNTNQNHAKTHPYQPHRSMQCPSRPDILSPNFQERLFENFLGGHPMPEMPVKIHVPWCQLG